MSKALAFVYALLFSVACCAAEGTALQLEQIDKQVQSLKSELIELTTEISRVEKQLYPEQAQVNIFVSLHGQGDYMLDSAIVLIDDVIVTSHLYTDAENRAMKRGGIQKIFSGHVVTGEHRLEMQLVMRTPDEIIEKYSGSYTFDKTSVASYIEAQLVTESESDSDRKSRMVIEFREQ